MSTGASGGFAVGQGVGLGVWKRLEGRMATYRDEAARGVVSLDVDCPRQGIGDIQLVHLYLASGRWLEEEEDSPARCEACP